MASLFFYNYFDSFRIVWKNSLDNNANFSSFVLFSAILLHIIQPELLVARRK